MPTKNVRYFSIWLYNDSLVWTLLISKLISVRRYFKLRCSAQLDVEQRGGFFLASNKKRIIPSDIPIVEVNFLEAR